MTTITQLARSISTNRTIRNDSRPKRGRLVTGLEPLDGRLLMSGYGYGQVATPKAYSGSGSATYPSPASGNSPAPVVSPPVYVSQPLSSIDPAVVGSWTAPVKFKPPGAHGPYLAIHSTLLPNGDVVAWPHDYNYFNETKHAASYTPNILLWNPATNKFSATTLPGTNLFCSGHTFLPDGKLLVLGGHGSASIPVSGLQVHYGQNHAETYDYRTNTWQRAENMGQGRYYGSAITLGTGEALVLAGFTEQGYNNPQIEIYKEGKGWRTLSGATTSAYPDWYPHLYQLSNGLVVGTNPGDKTFYLDPTGNGRIWPGPTMNYPRRYYGTSVMYDQDKILVIGGDAASGTAATGGNNLITNTAEVINYKDPKPAWHYTGSMSVPRLFPNATLLPDGTVLVTGGTREQSNPNGNALRGADYAAESWDPRTGRWTILSSMQVPRLYHSTALLLPDGRVLVAGGGQPMSSGEPNGTIHDDMQIFSPPYLFKGARPVIASAPASSRFGATIAVTSPNAASIKRINLIRLGSTTHGFNMSQRIVHLTFSHQGKQGLQVHMPTNADAAPPGYYMLFILNDRGVPSTARFVQLKT